MRRRPERRSDCTTFVPEYELLLADTNPDVESVPIMALATGERGAVLGQLSSFIDSYSGLGKWPEGGSRCAARGHEVAADGMSSHANWSSSVCELACRRFRPTRRPGGPSASRIPRWRGRWPGKWLREGKPAAGPTRRPPAWRPFQLGFLLLCMPGVVNDQSPDRNIADLLWFPTGGGKTEAYLGLIAFVIFLRRLARPARTATESRPSCATRCDCSPFSSSNARQPLICACEHSAAGERIGGGEITIGLWVGQDATPNTRQGREAGAEPDRGGADLAGGQPRAAPFLPLVRRAARQQNYFLNRAPAIGIRVGLQAAAMRLQDGLPVFLVDEDIYDYRPSLLIATVDKFAATRRGRAETVALFASDGPRARLPS